MNKLLSILVVLLLLSCNSESVSGLQVKYFKNAVEKVRTVGIYKVSCRLKNTALLNGLFMGIKPEGGQVQLEAMLNIDLNEGSQETDVMMTNLSSFEEYKYRINDLNFNVMDDITLDLSERSIHPILTNLENTYGLGSGRTINLVFNESGLIDELKGQSALQLTYTDRHFGTGIHHFTFSKEEIETAIN